METGISEVLSPYVIHNIESSSQYEDWLWLHNILFVIKQYIYFIFKILLLACYSKFPYQQANSAVYSFIMVKA